MTIPILNGNSLSQNGILVAIAVTLVVAVGGAVLSPSPESTTLILGLCAVVVTNLVGLLKQDVAAVKQDVAAVKLDVAAAKVDEVKVALVESNKVTAAVLDGIATTGEQAAATGKDTHTLVNSNYGIALLTAVTALEEVVEFAPDPVRKEAARERLNIAKQQYADHQAKQDVVDSGRSSP